MQRLISKVVLYGLLPLCIQAYLTDDELSYLGSKVVKRKNLNLEKEGKLIESPEKVMPKEGFFCSWTKVHFILVRSRLSSTLEFPIHLVAILTFFH